MVSCVTAEIQLLEMTVLFSDFFIYHSLGMQ